MAIHPRAGVAAVADLPEAAPPDRVPSQAAAGQLAEALDPVLPHQRGAADQEAARGVRRELPAASQGREPAGGALREAREAALPAPGRSRPRFGRGRTTTEGPRIDESCP
jgi:hypothetical protein